MKIDLFKNLIAYNFTRELKLPGLEQGYNMELYLIEFQDHLERMLNEFKFKNCEKLDFVKNGWASPLGKASELLTNICDGQVLICYKEEKKVIPNAELERRLSNRVESIEKETGEIVTKKERSAIKESIIVELLPHAFSKFEKTWIWIDLIKHRLCVDAGSTSKAENAISLLRKTIGSLPIIPFSSKESSLVLTNWVKKGCAESSSSSLPKYFELGFSAKLDAQEVGEGKASFKDRDLNDDAIQEMLNSDMYVTSLALNYGETKEHSDLQDGYFSSTLKFNLTKDLDIKGIKYSEFDFIDVDIDDFAAEFSATFSGVSGILSILLDRLAVDFSVENDVICKNTREL